MKPVIFHLGLSPPPKLHNTHIKLVHTPVIEVEYRFRNDPGEISELLRISPIVLILSQNGVRGLKQWLSHNSLEADYFNNIEFWTVGERTHEYLQMELNITSTYPDDMTGAGAINAILALDKKQLLLISGQELRKEFLLNLTESGINYYQFSVYETNLIENKILQFSFQNSTNNYLVFTSPSTVTGFLQILHWGDFSKMSAYNISIGPTTSNSIRQRGGNIFIESELPNINNLYQQLNEFITIPV